MFSDTHFRKKSANMLRKPEEEVRTEKEGIQGCKQIRNIYKGLGEGREGAANVQVHHSCIGWIILYSQETDEPT